MLEDLKGGQGDGRVRPELDHLTQVKCLDLICSITVNHGKVEVTGMKGMPYRMNWQLDSASVGWEET